MIPTQTFWAPFLWGLGVLAAWAGWGVVLGRWFLGPGRRVDLGLATGWGLCAMLIAGGVLNALRLCSPGLLAALVVAGWLGLIPALRRPPGASRQHRERRAGPLLAALPLVLWGGVIVAGSLSWDFGPINPADDLANYLMYPVKMLQSGAAIEPFNIRRLSTFGGQAFLQAVIEVAGTEKNAFLLDAGLGAVTVVLLLAGEVGRRSGAAWATLMLAATCWLYPMPRVNTMTAWIGTAVALTLLRTAAQRAMEPDGPSRLRLLFAMGMAGAACASLRANYLPLPLLFLALALAWDARTRPTRAAELGRDALVLAASFALMLLPWALALLQSSGTPLYPLIRGNHRAAFFAYSDGAALGERVASVWPALASPGFAGVLACLLVAPLLREWVAAWFGIAALAVTAATIVAFPNSEIAAWSRYTIPLLLAPALFGIAALLARAGGHRTWRAVAAGVACAAFLLGPAPATWVETLRRQAAAAIVAWSDREPPFQAPLYLLYAATQEAIPRGARVASVVDFPSLWDYRRHRIDCLDFPGAAVPHGPMPFFAGPEALLEYLRAEGFDYLVYFDFGRARGMYHRDWYASLVPTSIRPMNRVAVHTLDFMANVEQLATTQPIVFERSGMRVIRLR